MNDLTIRQLGRNMPRDRVTVCLRKEINRGNVAFRPHRQGLIGTGILPAQQPVHGVKNGVVAGRLLTLVIVAIQDGAGSRQKGDGRGGLPGTGREGINQSVNVVANIAHVEVTELHDVIFTAHITPAGIPEEFWKRDKGMVPAAGVGFQYRFELSTDLIQTERHPLFGVCQQIFIRPSQVVCLMRKGVSTPGKNSNCHVTPRD